MAADALYEGPSGVLSVVDHRQSKRMVSQVLDHDPTPDDLIPLLGRLKTARAERHWTLQGITTDGSALSPEPIRTVFGAVPHQLCPCHVIKDLTDGVLPALASERKRWATSKPTVKRGRPSSTAKAARRFARQSKAIQQHLGDVCAHRLLFVPRRLTPSERRRRIAITRGVPHLRTLREIMEHLDALFDRRCHPQSARGTLKQLRHWVQRFRWSGDTVTKVFSPPLDKALTLLDDTLLPATSNAVERGNRRHRKMQKRVYRVRSKDC